MKSKLSSLNIEQFKNCIDDISFGPTPNACAETVVL